MSGYCDCACRDCFEIAIGELGEAFCNACEESGCELDEECQAPGAYGVDEYMRDEDPDEPDDSDWTTTDHKTFYQYGRPILTLTGEETAAEMWAQILATMSAANFWPNVWFISDHGNAHLMRDPRVMDPKTGLLK